MQRRDSTSDLLVNHQVSFLGTRQLIESVIRLHHRLRWKTQNRLAETSVRTRDWAAPLPTRPRCESMIMTSQALDGLKEPKKKQRLSRGLIPFCIGSVSDGEVRSSVGSCTGCVSPDVIHVHARHSRQISASGGRAGWNGTSVETRSTGKVK